MADGPIVRGFIDIVDLEGLQHFAPPSFDWSQPLAGETHDGANGVQNVVPALLAVIMSGLFDSGTKAAEMTKKRLQMIAWLLHSRADPVCPVSFEGSAGLEIFKPDDRKNTVVTLLWSGQSVLSWVIRSMEALRKGKGGADWSYQCKYLEDVLALIKKSRPANANKVVVHRDVASMWESVREMTSSHNVIFETLEQEVSAHDYVLMTASPVLKAMLESSMKEGSCRRIHVKDSSSRGVSLFLDLLYTSSSGIEDLDYKTMMVALDLAHRWHVQHIVDMLADSLQLELNADSFVEIAEASVLKCIEPLQRACVTFGTKNADIQSKLQQNSLPPSVQKLMGEPGKAVSDSSKPKRRRFS